MVVLKQPSGRRASKSPPTTQLTIWTIGHSTRSSEEFLSLLAMHEIGRLVDVRRYPGSRRYPHFNSDALAARLPQAGLVYQHMPDLGGRRPTRPDSRNVGWKNAGFRGYADYMQTAEFHMAIEELTSEAARSRTVIMCAEAVPWRCHRSLIADRLLIEGWEVRHITGSSQAQKHRLTAFAVQNGPDLLYPASENQETSPRLF
jgi:uncharacterized protein (DUF488 family)